ncbi:hypothetical protein SETIT_1G304400v2 [Setaria italica]|uniref:Knottin scorpion toxin-like domain-containing protein n=2 Tax=Setaria TaxID=4554 RepID=A0A368PR97_SETIT|nr:hypothetical protein SETIT_1G304400v2 [Setaria italica]TKW41371.1 hypothetical protein SEVIR_1G310400v2 [Setaria viridis]
MGIITSRATLLVLAALVLCSATTESMPPSPSPTPTPSPNWWCRRVIEPFGPCDHASCKVLCSRKYDGDGVCIGKPEGCQCTYCPRRPPPAGDDEKGNQ